MQNTSTKESPKNAIFLITCRLHDQSWCAAEAEATAMHLSVSSMVQSDIEPRDRTAGDELEIDNTRYVQTDAHTGEQVGNRKW